MPLARLRAPFAHDEWIFEPKIDGFRTLARVQAGRCVLMSLNRDAFKTFPALAAAITAVVQHEAIIDGEIVCLGPDGKSRFYDLMRRRGPQYLYAFDLLWLGGRDLRTLPLLEREALLKGIVSAPVLYLDHIEGHGVELFHACCDQDMEGVVVKLSSGRYEPNATTWVKIKNVSYSQAAGRADFFDRRSVIVAGKHIRKLTFGRRDDSVLRVLRRVLRESRLSARSGTAS